MVNLVPAGSPLPAPSADTG